MTLEEKLKEIDTAWEKFPEVQPNPPVVKLLAALRKCREQRDELAYSHAHIKVGVLNELLRKDDAEILTLLEGAK